jgi:hypothetical protein
MQTTTMLTLIIAALVLALIGLAVYTRHTAGSARANGYDQGYDDARKAAADYTTSLEGQLANCVGRYAKAKREHDQQLQDADRRIAIYAGRSWTREDITLLKRGAKQLKLAAITYSEFEQANLAEPARFALEIGSQLEQLAKRTEAQLDGTAPTSTSSPEALQAEATATLLAVAAEADTLTNGKSWLVYGPEGCGKTKNAQAIADALGLTEIVDDWQPGNPAPITKALVLTNHLGPDFPPFYRRALSYEQAMSLVAAKAKQGVAA